MWRELPLTRALLALDCCHVIRGSAPCCAGRLFRFRMRKPSVLVIFLTVFIDLIGFGIVVPLIPSYGEHLGAQGAVIGLIFASFSLMQFTFAPIWGRLSDRHGRRPILLLSTAGASASYVLFARSTGLANHVAAIWVMVVSRLLAGAFGGNITVAQAYIADITPAASARRRWA